MARLPSRCRKDGFEVLRSDPDVFAGSTAACVDDLDVHDLVVELVERNASLDLGPVRDAWTRRIDDLQPSRRQD
jgi:hypothetical protein